MSPSETPALPRWEGEEAPAFAEPWHAQVFALTVRLSEAGHFTWPQWAEVFAGELERASQAGAPKDGSAYYDVWLTALERILRERGLAGAEEVAALKEAWTQAYLATPHGQPVSLKR